MVEEKTTTLRPANKPGDELLKTTTATPIMRTIQAPGFAFACPHCGKKCEVNTLMQEQVPVVKALGAKQEVAMLGCPDCGKDFKVAASMLVQPATTQADVQKAVGEITAQNPMIAGGNRAVRRAAAAGLKLVMQPRNGSGR